MTDRYKVGPAPGSGGWWTIYDTEHLDICRLPNEETGRLHPLLWGNLNRHGADAWLAACVRQWGGMPQAFEPHPMPVLTL